MPYASMLTLDRPGGGSPLLPSGCVFTADSYLEALVVGEAPAPPHTAFDAVNGTAWMEAGQAAQRAAEDAAEAARAAFTEAGQRGAVSAHVAGVVHLSDLIVAAARCTDLVVLPVGPHPMPGLTRAVIDGALFDSGTPLMAFAPGHQPVAAPGTAIIAWSATPQSGRAVRAALPLLKAAETVIAVLIDPHPSPRGFSHEPGYDLAAYLGRHGVAVDVLKLPSEDRGVSEILATQVHAQGADLLVMGAYGHARMTQRIFGGTTQAILKAPPCPTLMLH